MLNFIDQENRLIKPFTGRKLGKNNPLTSDGIDTVAVRKLFIQMCENSDDYGKRLTLTTYIYMMTDMINREFLSKENSEQPPLNNERKMVLYVNQHLLEKTMVSKLANHFYLSSSQFSRVFKKATGASPWEYIIQKRLTVAKEKIRSGFSAQQTCEYC